jgi:hypothetical protein
MRIAGLLALVWAIPSAYASDAKVVKLDSGVTVIQSKDHTYYTGLKRKPEALRGFGETTVTLADCDSLPEQFDLRDLNVVGPTRDQGQCGSCWAFSQTQSLESANAANGGQLYDLSEQELVSCDTAQSGCEGGLLNGFGYQIQHGQSLLKDFPYTAADGSCVDGLKPATKGSAFVNVGSASTDGAGKATEKDVMCALYKSHTIPWITVAASDAWSSPPTGDNDVYTGCQQGQVNHAVGVIGWTTINGKVYFKMRNSWANTWGGTAARPGAEKGYMLMQLGCDNLGDEVAYIQTKAQGCMAPEPKLPAEITVGRGDELKLSVRGEAGVDYTWLEQGAKESVGSGDTAFVTPTKETVYKVIAKNACGTSESKVRVKVIAAE